MQPSLEKLRKFFNLEHKNGYNDTAIIGGLAKMLDYWEGEARADKLSEDIIQAVVQRLQSYGKLTPDSRAESLKGLWKRIGDQYPEATQKKGKGVQHSQPRPATDKKESSVSQPEPDKKSSTPPGRSETVPGGKTSATPAALNAELTVLQGVGPRHAQTLGKLGMHTLGDMLY